ncbi:hypothetical protein [Marivirga sp.]|uniref:hypothetical protein n=1 Tax=Marivirga sp. TaxID=2018662 RepID=UPI002D7FC49F|nr:hypothetical protein [Marivirga sp.]HET8858936.1 hypothetical protein [Marivirga sp.]
MFKNLKSLIEELATDKSYVQYLKTKGVDRFFPENFFTLKTEQERLEAWENIEVKLKEIKDFNKVANPYYIGFGNPEADLLIVGQEKAFNAFNNPELMLYESINNSFQWSKIINNGDLSEINFDPRNPRKLHDEGRSGNHTWSKYSILTDAFYGISSCHENMKKHWNQNSRDTLFDKAFTTELNVTPAVSNSGLYLSKEREQLLSNPFFKDFKVVVFAIGSPEKGKKAQKVVSEIYEGIDFEVVSIGKYGKERDRYIAIATFENQVIVICNQLSGSSGWRNEHIVALGEKLRGLI